MRVICPNCSHRLEVDAVLATGSTFRVRCSKCEDRFDVDRVTGEPVQAGGTSPEPRTDAVGAPVPDSEEQIVAFRATLAAKHQSLMILGDLELLGLDETCSEAAARHAFLGLSEQYDPTRYEGQLSAHELAMVNDLRARVGRAFQEVSVLLRARRERTAAVRVAPAPPPAPPAPPAASPASAPSAPSATPVEEPPTSSIADPFERGTRALKSGKLAEAREQFARCVKADPNRPDYRVKLAVALMRSGAEEKRVDFQTVESHFKRALEIAPDHVDAWLGLGAMWNLRGHPNKAAHCFKQAQALDPGNVEATREIRLYQMRKKGSASSTSARKTGLFGFLRKRG